MPRDIRELANDPAAYAAELQARWGGLLSYRYIGRTYDSMDLGPTDNTVAIRQDMRDPAGSLLLAVLGIASPEGGGMSDLEAVPNPVVHSCQILDPGHDVTRLEVRGETLKRGRQFGYSRSMIVDADRPERVLAVTEGQGISLGAPPPGLQKMPVEPIHIVDSPDLPPLWQVFGGSQRPDGNWVLAELADAVASPDAALHIGPQFVILETAARAAATSLTGNDLHSGVSSHVMFMSRGKVGPFRAEAEAVDTAGARALVRVLLYDEGNQDRLITAASYQFEYLQNRRR